MPGRELLEANRDRCPRRSPYHPRVCPLLGLVAGAPLDAAAHAGALALGNGPAGDVNYSPKSTSVDHLRSLPAPSGLDSTTRRLPGAEMTTFRVKAQLLEAVVDSGSSRTTLSAASSLPRPTRVGISGRVPEASSRPMRR